jgi:hypothetical protein
MFYKVVCSAQLALQRTVEVDFMRHSCFLDKTKSSISRADAFFPLWSSSQGGLVPEFSQDTFHAALACNKNERLYSKISLPSYINTRSTIFVRTLRIPSHGPLLPPTNKILLGGPLHRANWGSTTLPIKVCQKAFLDLTTPRLWQLLQTKAHRGRATIGE